MYLVLISLLVVVNGHAVLSGAVALYCYCIYLYTCSAVVDPFIFSMTISLMTFPARTCLLALHVIPPPYRTTAELYTVVHVFLCVKLPSNYMCSSSNMHL